MTLREGCWNIIHETGPQAYEQQVLPENVNVQAEMAIQSLHALHDARLHFWDTIAARLPGLEQKTRFQGGGDRALYHPKWGANWHILMKGHTDVHPLRQAVAVTMDGTYAEARRLLERLTKMEEKEEHGDVFNLPIESTLSDQDACDEFGAILQCVEEWQVTGAQKQSA